MADLHNGTVRLHYEVHGEGYPVVLLHGATVNFKYNYANAGWIQTLNEAGCQVIGLDFRGHGNSGKPHDAASYGTANLASDVIALLDHLAPGRVAVLGYSIGTAVALHLIQHHPERFDRAVLMATGDGLIGHLPYTFAETLPALAPVLEREEYPGDLPRHFAAYWNFVAATGGDKQALKALTQASYPPLSPKEAAAVTIPTLVISGENDKVLGCGPRLAQALGCAEYLELAGADHFSLAVDASARSAVVNFLKSPLQPL
jgi:pimeloyl-ACP methyl ester carboxylesterase